MKVRKVAFLLCTVLLINLLLPVYSFAIEYLDYRQLISRYVRQYGDFDTPIANFDIYVNGVYVASTSVNNNTSFVERLSQISNSGITVNIGDKITIKDRSRVGSGSKITKYDLQVAQGIVGDVSSRFNTYSNINQVITAQVPGEMVIFLNVADNYSAIPKFDNFSQYGNWRTEVIKNSSDPNIQIKGWYFTAFKLTVIDQSRPKSEFDIYYQGQNKTDNYSNPVELEKYPATVTLRDKSTTEKGSIVAWEWGRKLPNGNWQFVSNSQNPTAEVKENVETFRLRVKNSNDQWSTWTEHVFVSKLNEDEQPEPKFIKAELDGPEIAEWGKTIKLDSSRSVSTYNIVKREYWRRTNFKTDWTLQSGWENLIEPSEKTIEDGNASYIEYKIRITDSKGNTDEDIHRVNMIESIDPEIKASLVFDPTQTFHKPKISLEDYLNDNEVEVHYWVTAKHSSYVKTNLGHFYFFANIEDSEIRQYAGNEEDALNDTNFIEYIGNDTKADVWVNTRVDSNSINNAEVLGTFKFKPSNPVIKASLMLKSTMRNLEPDFATAYHTVEFEVDSIPPATELDVPYPFYPSEINNTKQKTITWTYYSEQDIPYKYSIVSLYRKDSYGYEEVFKNKVMTNRYLIVEGNAYEQYKIEVVVVDQLNKESNIATEEFTIIGAVPVIDIALDNISEPNTLKIEVYNNTPEEIEKLFPTSYTYWTIHDSESNLILTGEGEAPKTVDLDYKFDRGKYTVTQHAINTIGATAKASKDFEITSFIDFSAEPVIQFEDDLIKLIDKSKYITDKKWFIRGNNDTDFSELQLNADNEFTRNEGIYQVKLEGKGYFMYFGETTRDVTKSITFLSTKPTAAFILSGNLKMYKEIILDGSISEQMTDYRLQAKYPIDFSHNKTMFAIEPIIEPNGDVDVSRIEHILGDGKQVENNQVVFKARKDISIRIDKEGWYRAYYKVYNGRKESDWYIDEFYVSPELLPSVDINVGSSIVYREPHNELKSKLEVIVDYSSPDDKISLDKSKLLISYDKNNDGDFTNDDLDSMQWIMKDKVNLSEYFSDFNATWEENKAFFELYLDNEYKNLFGRFKFDFIAVEEPAIPNFNDLGEAPIMVADTFLLDDKKKIILVDNDKPTIHLETTVNNSVILWILEDSNRPFTNEEIEYIIKSFEMERVNVKVYIIDAKTNDIRSIEY